MTTPKWEAGKLYFPGDLVQPVKVPPAGAAQVANGDFSLGAGGWDYTGSVVYDTESYGPGTGSIENPANGVDGEAMNQTQIVTAPGASITARCLVRQGAAGVDYNRGWVILRWYDGAGSQIGADETGNVVNDGRNGAWLPSTVTAIAPASAAYARAGIWLGQDSDAYAIHADNLSISTNYAPPAEGLIYRAVQAAAGMSGSAEPAWPPILGQTVVDNEVTWEAVQTSRVVWRASPALTSGGAEPEWPTTPGAVVADGTIQWECVSRRVEDKNCPNTKVVAIVASKVFAVDRDIVRFSATANPLDWTSEEDAGYLATGLQQANSNDMAVLAPYRGNLAPMNANCFQNWQVDPDPSAMALLDQMDGIGSTWQQAACPVGNELFYLSALGVRTVGIANAAENLAAGDVGMPIDPLVREAVRVAEANGTDIRATYYPGAGQYWLSIDSTVFVYTMTRTGKVGAWSRYLFPFSVDAFAQLGNDLYIRNGDTISRVDESAVTDDVDGVATPFAATVWWPWLDFGQPGVTKMLEGFDYVGTGQGPSISIGYDQRSTDVFTEAYQLDPDTLPGGIIPFPVSAPTLSVKLEFAGGEAWNVQSVLLSVRDLRGGP